ncbi:hypothetical protein J6590_062758 [Homalodisca vitripennis]|nr:hypothetical protein J6590_062758 [Homalodisca vitripennis]
MILILAFRSIIHYVKNTPLCPLLSPYTSVYSRSNNAAASSSTADQTMPPPPLQVECLERADIGHFATICLYLSLYFSLQHIKQCRRLLCKLSVWRGQILGISLQSACTSPYTSVYSTSNNAAASSATDQTMPPPPLQVECLERADIGHFATICLYLSLYFSLQHIKQCRRLLCKLSVWRGQILGISLQSACTSPYTSVYSTSNNAAASSAS